MRCRCSSTRSCPPSADPHGSSPQFDCVALRHYGGFYVAHRNGEVIASAPPYNELDDKLLELELPWDEIIIEFVRPADAADATVV
jgi:hypothetical protein